MNILLPFDGKPHSQRAVDLAINFFNLPKCTVTLLHVVDAPSSELVMSDKTGRIEETYPEMAASESQVLLEFLAKKFEEAGAKVEIRIQHGKPGSEIKALLESNNIPVVVTTPGRHTGRELMLDSTITQQLLQVEYEVLLTLAREVKSDIVGDTSKPTCAFLLDGSDESAKALKLMLPLISGKMDVLLVSSRIGWPHSTNESVFQVNNPAIETQPAKAPEGILKEASAIADSFGIKAAELLLEEGFEDCFAALKEHRSLGLLVATRSRDDVLHRPLRGSAAERLFTSVPCNSALYCAAV